MATAPILLRPGAADPPDASSGNAAPSIERVQGTESNPKKHFVVAKFDAATDEHLYWSFRWPSNSHGTPAPVAKIQGMANATSGSARLGVRISATTPGDADTPIEHASASANTGAWAANGSEARRAVELSITLTNDDGVQAGDFVVVMFYRDADGTSGTDDLAVDFELIALEIDYTTA